MGDTPSILLVALSLNPPLQNQSTVKSFDDANISYGGQWYCYHEKQCEPLANQFILMPTVLKPSKDQLIPAISSCPMQ